MIFIIKYFQIIMRVSIKKHDTQLHVKPTEAQIREPGSAASRRPDREHGIIYLILAAGSGKTIANTSSMCLA